MEGRRRGWGTEASGSPYSQAAREAPIPSEPAGHCLHSSALHQETTRACLPAGWLEMTMIWKWGHGSPWSKIPRDLVHMSEIIWSSRCCEPLGVISLLCFMTLWCHLQMDPSTELGAPVLQSRRGFCGRGGSRTQASLQWEPNVAGDWTSQIVKGVMLFPF